MDYRARLLASAGALESGQGPDASERSVVRRNRLAAVRVPDDSPVGTPQEV
jgi:hypothetical protein